MENVDEYSPCVGCEYNGRKRKDISSNQTVRCSVENGLGKFATVKAQPIGVCCIVASIKIRHANQSELSPLAAQARRERQITAETGRIACIG